MLLLRIRAEGFPFGERLGLHACNRSTKADKILATLNRARGIVKDKSSDE